MTTEKKSRARTQMTQVVDLVYPPARVRKYMDPDGLNIPVEQKLVDVKQKLLELRKEGGPTKPTAPATQKRDASESEKKKHKAARDAYEAKLKEWNSFTSKRYEELETVYDLTRHLDNIEQMLRKTTPLSDSAKHDLESEQNTVRDQPPLKKKNETEEDHQARVEKFEKRGFTKYLTKGINLNDADAVKKERVRLVQSRKEIELFVQRDTISSERVRFNDPAAVAVSTAIQLGSEGLIEHAIKVCLKSGNRIIKPDHCISDGVEELPFWAFFENLPHVRAIREKQARYAAWEAERNKAKQEHLKRAKSKARRIKTTGKSEKFTFPSFQETEVTHGHAVKLVKKDEKEDKERVTYEWKGIDREDDANGDSSTFVFYVKKLCGNVVDSYDDSSAPEIRISANMRKFLADLALDFIARLNPIIAELLKLREVSTVSAQITMAAIKILLMGGYTAIDGKPQFSDEHEQLLKMMEQKVALCEKHTKSKSKEHEATEEEEAEAAAEAAKDLGEEAEEEAEETEEAAAEGEEEEETEEGEEEAEEEEEKPAAKPAKSTAAATTATPKGTPTKTVPGANGTPRKGTRADVRG